MNTRNLKPGLTLASAVVLGSLSMAGQVFSQDFYGTDEAFASEAVYFVVTDRFVNGDTSNDQRTQGQASGMGTWNKQLCDNGTNIGYMGGDFKGLLNNADYIAEMGFTSVWITPIVDNPNEAFSGGNPLSCGTGVGADNGKTGYHGYWAHNFYQVDEHWPSADLSFAQFNDAMETQHGLKTVLDIVANHGSPAFSMTQSQPNFGQLYDEDWNLVADHMNLQPSQLDHNNPLHQWYNKGGGLAQLSDLNENNPAVMDYLVGSYLKWIDQGVDAFRIDTIAWMPHSFWKEMSDRVRAQHPGFYMFGENFNFNAGTIAQHQKPENGDISVLDFPGKNAITSVFQNPSSNYSDILWYLDLGKEIYTNPYDLATFYDNHDMARMSAAGNPHAFVDANNWLFTTRGIPVVYYGSEMMFMNGLGEHAGNRNYYGEDNIAFARTTQTFNSLKNIANIRKNSVALQKGIQINGNFSGNTAHLFRVYEKDGVFQTALVMLNKGDNSASFNVSSLVSQGDWVDAQTGEAFADTASINTSVDAHSVKVLLLNAPTTNAQMLTALQGPPEKVTVSPGELVQNAPATVSYYLGNDNKNIELHWGINNWTGAGLPAGDEPMVYNADTGRYEATVVLPPMATQFDFVFHNLTDGTWDANGGADWHYPVLEDLCDCRPDAPSGVAVTAGDGSISLSWDATPRADEYQIYAYQNDQLVDNYPPTTETSYSVTGLVNGLSYDVYVQAVNAIGASQLSAVASATPQEVTNYATVLGTGAELRLTGLAFANWDAANTLYQLQMTGDHQWRAQVTLANDLNASPYKLTLNGAWAVNWGGGASGANASLTRGGSDATITLPAGTYELIVTEGGSIDAALSVQWVAAGTPDLVLSPADVNLGSLVVGATAQATLTAVNTGGGVLQLDNALESADWLTTQVNGLDVLLNIDTNGLIPGMNYQEVVTVNSNGGSELATIAFDVVDAPDTIAVTFSCFNGTTQVGQSVYVVGSVTELGNWDVAQAVKLDPTSYPTWTGTVQMPASSAIAWKCIKRNEINPNQDLIWQPGADNQLSTPETGEVSSNGAF